MTGILFTLLIIACIAVTILVPCRLIFRSVRRRRGKMLREMGLSLPFEEFVSQASDYRWAFLLNFGFGRELWAVLDDEPVFDQNRQIVINGKFLDRTGSIRDAVRRCEAIGISVHRIMMIDQHEFAGPGKACT